MNYTLKKIFRCHSIAELSLQNNLLVIKCQEKDRYGALRTNLEFSSFSDVLYTFEWLVFLKEGGEEGCGGEGRKGEGRGGEIR